MRRILLLLILALGTSGALAAAGGLIEVARHGEAQDDNYGEAVAGGADVDGDGAPDHLVTAVFNDDVASAAGKAYLYLGRAPALQAADLTFTGEAKDDQFGIAAAAGGDVNGDGFDDIVVGARFSDRAGTDTGSAFVFFGAPSPGSAGGMDDIPDLVVTGEAKDDWFANSVDFAGDFNGDGFDDIVVGAPFNDETGSASGKGYIFFGGAAPDTTPDVFLFGDPQDDGQFGWSISRAGDVNGDGFDDVIAGARLFGTGTTRAIGRAYVYYGSATPDGSPDVVMTGERKDDWFGNTVSEAGDFNRDGFDDVAVGAILWDDLSNPVLPLSAAGKVYVFFGASGTGMDGVADWTASGEGSDDQFGFSIAPAGDVDGNGGGDLLVGAPFHDDPSGVPLNSAGKAYLFTGPPSTGLPPGAAAFTRTGQAADDQYAFDVAGAGDGNGDGLEEILAGAHFADGAGQGSGTAELGFLDCLGVAAAGNEISWGGCGRFSSFDVRRTTVGGVRTGDYGDCVLGDVPASPLTLPEDPNSGEAFIYMISGREASPPSHLPIGFEGDTTGRPLQPICP